MRKSTGERREKAIRLSAPGYNAPMLSVVASAEQELRATVGYAIS
jgi:hypothetical protein